MRAAVLRYRVMAYITGVLIIVICFVGIPLQIAANQTFLTNQVATAHGFLYILYIVVAFLLAQRLRLRPIPTVLLLLAGTVPVLTFVVERHYTRKYIAPALAAEQAGGAQEAPAAQQETPVPQPAAAAGAPSADAAANGAGSVEEPAELRAPRPAGRFAQWLHGG